MRRLAVLSGLIAAVALVLGLTAGTGAQAGSTYRVDAIFDTAKGIIPGQLVKIAGARAGTIGDVVLTKNYKARIKMNVKQQFGPFGADASCEIQPEGLISENFVQCEPGDPKRNGALKGAGGSDPTVTLAHTSVPVSITDLFNIWKVPVRERFSVVLATLGAGTAARGQDLNALLLRASPTLRLVRKATRIAVDQTQQINRLVDSTDTVVHQLALRRGRVRDFIDRAGRVFKQTGDNHTALAQAIHQLPALLDAAQPALQKLDKVAIGGAPVARELHTAAPAVQRLVGDLQPFAGSSNSALHALGRTGVQGRKTAASAGPVVSLLRTFAHRADPTGHSLGDLFTSLRDSGFSEGLLHFVYNTAGSTVRYDSISHFVPLRASLTGCSVFATLSLPGCAARYSAAVTGGLPVSDRGTTRKTPAAVAAPGSSALPALPKVTTPKLPDLPRLPALPLHPPKLPETAQKPVKDLLDFLLK